MASARLADIADDDDTNLFNIYNPVYLNGSSSSSSSRLLGVVIAAFEIEAVASEILLAQQQLPPDHSFQLIVKTTKTIIISKR